MSSNSIRDTSGRFAKGNPGGPGRPKLDKAAYTQRIMDGIEPHVRAAVEQTIVRLIEQGTIPAGSATRVLDALSGMPLWLDVQDRRRPASIFYPSEQQCIAGLPTGEAVRRCRQAISEVGFDSFQALADSEHEHAWVAREVLATIAAGKRRRERGNDGE